MDFTRVCKVLADYFSDTEHHLLRDIGLPLCSYRRDELDVSLKLPLSNHC